MIVGGFAAGVRNLLEKDRQDTIFRKIRKIQKNTRKLYFAERLRKPEGGGERSQRAGTHTGGAAWPLAAPACCVALLAHFSPCPFAYFIVPENLSQGEGSELDTAASTGRKTPEREKLSGRQESVGEIPSRRGEIIAIVIAIAPDFIGIIITIISITSTFIFTITMPSRCNILS
jgi:hypothetical protein